MPFNGYILLSNITNLSDARYAAGMGVSGISIQVVPENPDFLPASLYQEIRGWISGPQVFADIRGLSDQDQLKAILESYKPDGLLLSPSESKFELPELPLILMLNPGEKVSGMNPDWVISTEIHPDFPLLLPVKTPDQLVAGMASSTMLGFVFSGGQEERPGYRDFDELGALFDTLPT